MISPIASLAETEQFVAESNKVVLFFWAAWHDASKVGGPMQSVFSALAQKHSSITFCTIEAEAVPECSEKYEVAVVPTFVALYKGALVGKLEGSSPSDLSKLIKLLEEKDSIIGSSNAATTTKPQDPTPSSSGTDQKALEERLKALIHQAPVMLFMKGQPTAPRCGFSRQMVEILNNHEVTFESFDILTDEEVRQGLKTYSDWPTYPQLYVHGNLAGGLDIVKEIVSSSAGDKKAFQEALGITVA